MTYRKIYYILSAIWIAVVTIFCGFFITPFLGTQQSYRRMVANMPEFIKSRIIVFLVFYLLSVSLLALGAGPLKFKNVRIIFIAHLLAVLIACWIGSALFVREVRNYPSSLLH